MKPKISALVAIMACAVSCAGYGCSRADTDADSNPQRGISSDISESLDHGPTAAYPGMALDQEPAGAYPWASGQGHADEP